MFKAIEPIRVIVAKLFELVCARRCALKIFCEELIHVESFGITLAGGHWIKNAKIKMKKFLQRLFDKPAPINSPRKNTAVSLDSLFIPEDGSSDAMRRQLILLLLRDLMRRQGLPLAWIELQLLMVNSTSRGEGLYVRLILKHWDARLINYIQAFQNELLADIVRFEPQFDTWMRGISWQLDMTASCPYTQLPGKAFWQAPAKQPADQIRTAPVTPEQPTPLSAKVLSDSKAATADLDHLFRLRDQELRDAATLYAPLEYEKTQPLQLQLSQER